jgi:hypothetical protein
MYHQQEDDDDNLLSKRRLTQDARTASDASFQSSASDLSVLPSSINLLLFTVTQSDTQHLPRSQCTAAKYWKSDKEE